MSGSARKVRISSALQAAVFVALTALPLRTAATAAPGSTFKVAFYNIKSGKGQFALAAKPFTFVDTINCTDRTQPLNAWGVGAVQSELQAAVASDPTVVALGLAEA